MPTFYQVLHYNRSTRNYNEIGAYTSRYFAETNAKHYLSQFKTEEFKKQHCCIIIKRIAVNGVYIDDMHPQKIEPD